jgi:hypothetical protein
LVIAYLLKDGSNLPLYLLSSLMVVIMGYKFIFKVRETYVFDRYVEIASFIKDTITLHFIIFLLLARPVTDGNYLVYVAFTYPFT